MGNILPSWAPIDIEDNPDLKNQLYAEFLSFFNHKTNFWSKGVVEYVELILKTLFQEANHSDDAYIMKYADTSSLIIFVYVISYILTWQM